MSLQWILHTASFTDATGTSLQYLCGISEACTICSVKITLWTHINTSCNYPILVKLHLYNSINIKKHFKNNFLNKGWFQKWVITLYIQTKPSRVMTIKSLRKNTLQFILSQLLVLVCFSQFYSYGFSVRIHFFHRLLYL